MTTDKAPSTQTPPQPQANPLAGVTPWAPCGRPYDHKWYESDTKGVIRIVNVDGALSIAVCDLLRILAWHARWRPEILTHYGWQQPPAAQDDDHAAALQRERERADRAERALRELVDAENAYRYAQVNAMQAESACDNSGIITGSTMARRQALHDARQHLHEQQKRVADALDAAHAALTAQRSDDTARVAGEEVAS